MTFIYLFLILGITILIHEFGHFIFAKKAGVYVYEFSIGMGPKLWSFKRKNDETLYAIRLLPIGGYVQMAGEQVEEDKNIPSDKQFQAKKWYQRVLIVIAGITFNFILSIIILFFIALFNGTTPLKPYIASVEEGYPIAETGIKTGDLITKINGQKVSTVDRLLLELEFNSGETITMEVKNDSGTYSYEITPVEETVDGETSYRYGFSLDGTVSYGFINALKYGFLKTASFIEQLIIVIGALITGKLSLNAIAGPVGIYTVVGETAKAGFTSIVFLMAYISTNVGFMNLLPIPAFDGGRLLFLIIEKIKGKPIDTKVENIIHSIGFILLMILMVVITYNDILRLFS
ncbi:MAG: RIP metalloprotease RseP [Bacilli bacterium]|nr:RIP metalloprotease RseP [Bacilli bacterium]